LVRIFENVLVNHEALIFRYGRIYPESFVAGSRNEALQRRPTHYAWFLLKNHWLRRGHVAEPSGLWTIDNYTPDNYYHWLVDALPRVLRAEQDEIAERTLLLPRYYHRNAYIEFTLRAFPRIDRIGWIGARTKTRVGRLAFVPRQPDDRLASQIPEVVRRATSLAGGPGSDRRIYFTRDDARWRRIRNEADVARVLRQHDVAFHRIDQSRPWEQMRAGAGANLIVGPHGASLTNLIFMAPGGRVIELRHPHDEYFADVYRPLAATMGLDYTRQDCELAPEAGGLPINDRDLIVDLDLLRENLR
jgi:capsular polysaccharide biosynthesis protein